MNPTIGQLARNAGVNVETIRYYERRGLIRRPLKPANGYRRYGRDVLARLQFIRRAKTLGFTLDEIANLLALSQGDCIEIRTLAEQKLGSVRAKISDLERLASVLDELVRQCDERVDNANCPIIETLADPS